jgi:hypothetical protein
MKTKNSPAASDETIGVSTGEDLNNYWQRVVRRRSLLKGLGITGAAATAPAILVKAAQGQGGGKLSRGDTAILRFLAAAEIIESDLWSQYAELGGVAEFQQLSNGNPGFNGGNTPYIAALANLDSDMAQYITDNTDDELSHAAFLNAYLMSKGEQPVNLDAFRTLPGSQATGVVNVNKKRLTNLMNLTVDTSWYTRYRSNQNPDLGATFSGPVSIQNKPGIPRTDADTADPNVIQAIANVAGFHFAFIEQGGSSLYTTMAQKAHDLEVLRIIVSIGGVEVDHFSLWHDKAGNAVAQPLAPLTVNFGSTGSITFPNLNDPSNNLELTQTNKILPEPCDFISTSLPKCSVIRPSSTGNAGAVAAVKAFTADGLFIGQPNAFFGLLMHLAEEADEAERDSY